MRADRDERLVEPVAEQRAVRETGQAVVEGLMPELLLEPDALGDVARVEHDAADLPVVAQVGHVRLEVAPLAEPVRHAEHDLVRLAVRAARRRRAARSSACTKLHEARAEHLRLAGGRPSSVTDCADVAAAAGAEHERRGRSTTVTRLRKCAVWRRVAGSAPSASEQRREQPGDAEHRPGA